MVLSRFPRLRNVTNIRPILFLYDTEEVIHAFVTSFTVTHLHISVLNKIASCSELKHQHYLKFSYIELTPSSVISVKHTLKLFI